MDTIFNAIRSKNVAAVKIFLDKNPNLINTKDQRGSTPLLLATYYGLEDITKLILTYNPQIDTQDASGNTALMGVCFKGYYAVAKLLIDAGADLNIKNYNQASSLIFAANFGQKEIIKLLIKKGADIYATDNKGYTAEMHAKNQGLDFSEFLNLTE